MASFEERIKAIEAKQLELHKKRSAIQDQEEELNRQIELIKLEELEKNSGLTQDEIKDVKNTISIIGRMLSSENVIFGWLRIVNEDPDITEGGYAGEQILKYSININCKFVSDYAKGLRYEVLIKTRNKTIVEIINSMISTNLDFEDDLQLDEDGEYIKPQKSLKTIWSIDWDYHQKFILKS